ncbi:MAG: hypothetical protein DDT21_01541 [Syntrophomonadaceae bacterium]|nr:hypothetical protein [Bacillota bacterium]MCL5982381.1 gamma-glutamylcyclotransferase [Bacillota bacterium]
MDKHNKLYIAYGSNLNREQMADRCPTARVLGTSMMDGWRLLFRGAREGAVAAVEPCQGGSVPVLVWEITPVDEAALDRYEGWPYFYRKETVKVKLDGKPVTAMVYIMNEGRPLGQPSCYYYAVILEGYKDAGFDVDILRQATIDSAETEETAHD